MSLPLLPSLPVPVLASLTRDAALPNTPTHQPIDLDSRLLRSTCGAYEILMWDADTGKKILSLPGGRSTESDIKWATFTSPLGFGVMGVWPEGADGTDINCVDVSFKKVHSQLTVTIVVMSPILTPIHSNPMLR